MNKTLNLDKLKRATDKKGLSQADVACQLNVSREAVSKWFSGKSIPRPNKLLKLALITGLQYDQLIVIQESLTDPVVAFRKKANRITTAKHINTARTKGLWLNELVKYLPSNNLTRPATLKSPINQYEYIQKVATEVRNEIGVNNEEKVSLHHLISKFDSLQAIIIPVMWGHKDKHENALHIYLPESMTTWVYLNLDSESHDFKFWIAHELAHTLAPDLRDNEGEDFADAFAGALLFPEECVIPIYNQLLNQKEGTQINKIKHIAETYEISPITVYKEIKKFAHYRRKEMTNLEPNIYRATTNFNKGHMTITQTLFNNEMPTPKIYFDKCRDMFQTCFFEVLKECLIDAGKSAGFIQTLLDVTLLDAKGLYVELT